MKTVPAAIGSRRSVQCENPLTMQEYAIQTPVSGRYLVRLPLCSGPAPILAGFHGYGQTAEDELALILDIPGSEKWLCCSIEALHPFYNPKGFSGASWMTSRQRELRIEENVRYVDTVIVRLRESYPVSSTLIFHGFSQGAGMAIRAAILGRHRTRGVMLLGGDIPPGISLSGWTGRVHIARGSRDPFYPQERFEQDIARLHDAGVPSVFCGFTGGHGGEDEYFRSAGEFLTEE